MTILRKFDKKNFRLKKKKKMNNDDDIDTTSSRTTTDKYCFFNGDEKEVVKILQQLPQFILESESSSYPCFLLITWGVKKRRSLTTNTCYSHLPCNSAIISSGKSSLIPSNPLSFSSSGSFSKHPTCTNKAKKMKMKMKSKDTLTSSSRKQENQRKTFVKLMMGDCNDQKSSPSFPDQQRDKLLHSNSSRKSFDLSSVAGPTVFYPATDEEEEEEGSLTKVADESRFGSEMNEQKKKSKHPYSQIAQSLSGEVGHLVMAKHLSIPDLNLGPDENPFKSFDMNKQPPLQLNVLTEIFNFGV